MFTLSRKKIHKKQKSEQTPRKIPQQPIKTKKKIQNKTKKVHTHTPGKGVAPTLLPSASYEAGLSFTAPLPGRGQWGLSSLRVSSHSVGMKFSPGCQHHRRPARSSKWSGLHLSLGGISNEQAESWIPTLRTSSHPSINGGGGILQLPDCRKEAEPPVFLQE